MLRGNDDHFHQGHRSTILVGDDDAAVAKTLAMVLEQAGFCTFVAYDAGQALGLAMDVAFDLAAVDVRLPDGRPLRPL